MYKTNVNSIGKTVTIDIGKLNDNEFFDKFIVRIINLNYWTCTNIFRRECCIDNCVTIPLNLKQIYKCFNLFLSSSDSINKIIWEICIGIRIICCYTVGTIVICFNSTITLNNRVITFGRNKLYRIWTSVALNCSFYNGLCCDNTYGVGTSFSGYDKIAAKNSCVRFKLISVCSYISTITAKCDIRNCNFCISSIFKFKYCCLCSFAECIYEIEFNCCCNSGKISVFTLINKDVPL